MQDVTIGLIQQHSVVNRVHDNLDQCEAWARRAAERGAELILFPELNITGHAGCPAMVECAEHVPQGPVTQRLIALAKQLRAGIAFGLAEDDRGVYYNTQALVGPDGFIGKQRKTHLSHDEYYYFRGGDGLSVFHTPWGRIGMVVCYDNLVPEVSRVLAVRGAELLLCPHAARFGAWPSDRASRETAVREAKAQWRLVHRARAYDNGVFVALCNAVGRAAEDVPGVDANHAGGCMVIDPDGEVLGESSTTDIEEDLLVVRLSSESVRRRRLGTCFNLRTRRPEVFGPLTALSSGD